MAIASAMVWEVRSTATASNVNGGGFKTGASGVDYSQQDAAQYNLTGGASAGAGAVILHASAAADMVGNVGHLISGTNSTAGWYEITAVSVGVSITVDRNCTTGVGASIVFNVGGALATLDTWSSTANTLTAGNKIYLKGSLTAIGGSISLNAGTTGAGPIILEGYATARGDLPLGATRPMIACGANTLTLGAYNVMRNVQLTGTNTSVIITQSPSRMEYCKVTNSSTTTTRVAINAASNSSAIITGCEAISYRGSAISMGSNTTIIGCYIHDSVSGIINVVGGGAILYCIIACNSTNGISASGTNAQAPVVFGNTIYGSEAQTGTGIAVASGQTTFAFLNNIIYGLATGIADSAGLALNYYSYNTFSNNGTNSTGVTAGPNQLTTAPQFAGVAQITGTNGTTSASVLTSAGANFASVTDNVDFVNLISGTGITAAQYLITAHTSTTLTLSSAPGTSAVADKVFQITTGKNFGIGSNLVGLGYPGAFPAALSTGYMDIGAVQKQVTGSSGMLYLPNLEGT